MFKNMKSAGKENKARLVSKPGIVICIVGITLFFTVYEFFKSKVMPDLTMWQSHVMSISMVCVLSTVFFILFREIVLEESSAKEKMNQDLLKEINERRQAEKALKESEHLLRESQKIARIGSFIVDLKADVWKGTPETNAILGIDEAYPHTVDGLLDIVHPDVRKRIISRFNKAEAEKTNFDFEYKIIPKNTGGERWVHGSGGFEHDDASDADFLICTIQDVTDRRIKEEENYYLSYHDQLTGLYNRRFYEEELKRLDTARNLPLTVIMGDVNGLKLINDSFGHDAGDELLKKTANIIKKCCRADDIIARTGGDEFVMVMPKLDSVEAEAIIRRIKGYAETESIENISISISLGFETKRDPEEPINEVLKRAEDHMYKKKLLENQSLRGKTIRTIITTLHEKNKREELHSNRVSMLCESMGVALGLPDYQIMELKTVGLFHDIGKIAIDEDILNKKEILTDEEWDEMKRHSEIGYRILSTSNEMSEMAGYVLAHHERWDGNGYPRGLKGSEIPLESRIISIADAYDAMTSESCYQDIVSEEEAVKILKKGAGVKFDPALVDVFIKRVLGRAG